MTSHDLANQLLAMPNLPVVNSDDAEIEEAMLEEDGELIILYSEDDDDDEQETETEGATSDE